MTYSYVEDGISKYSGTYRVVSRGTGKNVAANRRKTPKEIDGYLSIACMRNAILTRHAVYETLVRSM